MYAVVVCSGRGGQLAVGRGRRSRRVDDEEDNSDDDEGVLAPVLLPTLQPPPLPGAAPGAAAEAFQPQRPGVQETLVHHCLKLEREQGPHIDLLFKWTIATNRVNESQRVICKSCSHS